MLTGNAGSVVMKVAYSIKKAAEIFNKTQICIAGHHEKSTGIKVN